MRRISLTVYPQAEKAIKKLKKDWDIKTDTEAINRAITTYETTSNELDTYKKMYENLLSDYDDIRHDVESYLRAKNKLSERFKPDGK